MSALQYEEELLAVVRAARRLAGDLVREEGDLDPRLLDGLHDLEGALERITEPGPLPGRQDVRWITMLPNLNKHNHGGPWVALKDVLDALDRPEDLRSTLRMIEAVQSER